ncbi:MAG: peptidoglycan-binding domain-containing protein [Variovorax sp.]
MIGRKAGSTAYPLRPMDARRCALQHATRGNAAAQGAAMDILMTKGSVGEDVERLRRALATVLGGDAAMFASLLNADAPIDEDFDAAIRRWQAGVGLIADGIVGPRCQLLLDLLAPQADQFELALNVSVVSKLFPATKPANIARYLPYVEAALGVAQLTDRPMILGALGTIRAETEGKWRCRCGAAPPRRPGSTAEPAGPRTTTSRWRWTPAASRQCCIRPRTAASTTTSTW